MGYFRCTNTRLVISSFFDRTIILTVCSVIFAGCIDFPGGVYAGILKAQNISYYTEEYSDETGLMEELTDTNTFISKNQDNRLVRSPFDIEFQTIPWSSLENETILRIIVKNNSGNPVDLYSKQCSLTLKEQLRFGKKRNNWSGLSKIGSKRLISILYETNPSPEELHEINMLSILSLECLNTISHLHQATEDTISIPADTPVVFVFVYSCSFMKKGEFTLRIKEQDNNTVHCFKAKLVTGEWPEE